MFKTERVAESVFILGPLSDKVISDSHDKGYTWLAHLVTLGCFAPHYHHAVPRGEPAKFSLWPVSLSRAIPAV